MLQIQLSINCCSVKNKMLRASNIAAILSARGKDTFVTQGGLCAIRDPHWVTKAGATVALANVNIEEAKKILQKNPQFTQCKIYSIPIIDVDPRSCFRDGLIRTIGTRRTPAYEFYQFGDKKIFIDDVKFVQEITVEPSSERTPEDWVSASSTRCYLLKDPVVDYFNRPSKTKKRKYGQTCNKPRQTRQTRQPGNWLMECGNKFENDIMSVLYKNFPGQIVTIGTGHGDSSNISLYHATIDSMKRGVPIVYQGVLHDSHNKTIGSPDLLVRTDFLHNLVKNPPPVEIETTVFGEYMYCVVDIKWSTLKFRADGETLLTEGSVPAYKGQCWVYTQALGQMQGTTPHYAYILGRKWVWKSKGVKYQSTDALSKLGVIDYHTVDAEYASRTPAALEWRRYLAEHGDTFIPGDPKYPELYPNMVQRGSDHAAKKQKLADKIGEITSIWNCGVKERNRAHRLGVYSWKDPDFGSELLGWKNKQRAKILDAILRVNRVRPGDAVCSAEWELGKNFKLVTPPRNTTEVFIDFETLSSICTDSVKVGNTIMSPDGDMVFMVGVGHIENGEWVYQGFIAENRTVRAEYEMFCRVFRYLKQFNKYVAYHWSGAEPRFYNSATRRIPQLRTTSFAFVDLLEHVRSAPLVVNGALDFSVKSIGRALYNLGEVNTTWSPEDNALSVMVEAMKAYKKPNPEIALQPVLRYNEVDCKIMWEILEFIRRVS